MPHTFVVCIVIVFILIAILFWYLLPPKLDNIPHRPGHWFFGHLLELIAHEKNVFEYLSRYASDVDEKTFALHMPLGKVVFLMKPECIQHMFVKNFTNYHKGPNFHDIFGELLGDGIFNVDGSLWRKHRKMASYMFSLRQLRDRFVATFTSHITTFIQILDDVKPGELIDLQALFFKYTFDAFCEIGFGYKVDSLLHDHPFEKAFDRANVIAAERLKFHPSVYKTKRFLNIGKEREFRQCLDIVNSTVNDIIKQTMGEDLSASQMRTVSRRVSVNSRIGNILDLFMAKAKEKGTAVNVKELRDLIMNFIIAGRDTTAWACTALTYFLLKHPNEEAKVDIESHNVFEGQTPTYEEAGQLKVLDAALMEALRLLPSVAIDIKFAINDDIMPDGTQIDAGQMIIYSAYLLGRSKNIWGENVQEFLPSRWLENDFKPSDYSYPVFNVAPRLCLGKTMAMIEAKLLLSSLLKRYQFTLSSQTDASQLRQAATISFPTGLMVTVKKR